MPTPTGDFVVDFTALANVNPYPNTNFTKIDTGNWQILSGALKPATASGLARFRYNGAMQPGATIRSKIEMGVSHLNDYLWAFILDPSGNGYGAFASTTFTGIISITAGAVESGLTSGTLASANPGDILILERVPGTNILNTYLNGTLSLSVTDATWTTGLAFAIGFDPENTDSSTMLGFAGDGVATGGGAALASNAVESTSATGTFGLRNVVADLVFETTTTAGTSPFVLGGAITGYRTFGSAMVDQDTCLYLAQAVTTGIPNGPWEIGIGTYAASTNTLTRTQVIKSSNSNAAVSFPAGTAYVALTEPAEALWNKGVFNAGNSGASITIDWANGPYQMVTLNSAAPVVSFANPAICPHGVLELYQDPTGGRVPTIAGAVYRSGSPPTWSTTNATHDTLHVHYNAVTGKSNVFAET